MMRNGVLVLLALLIAPLIAAQDGSLQPTHQFYGEVVANGAPAPDGLRIEARITDVVVGAGETLDGRYGYEPLFKLASGEEGVRGGIIRFFVEGVEAASHPYSIGDEYSAVTRLDLEVEGLSLASDAISTKGGILWKNYLLTLEGDEEEIISEVEDETRDSQGCDPDWYCSEWMECVGGEQQRVCVDTNDCADDSSRPDEVRGCGGADADRLNPASDTQTRVENDEPRRGLGAITGAVIGNANGWSIGALLVLLLGILLLIAARRAIRD